MGLTLYRSSKTLQNFMEDELREMFEDRYEPNMEDDLVDEWFMAREYIERFDSFEDYLDELVSLGKHGGLECLEI